MKYDVLLNKKTREFVVAKRDGHQWHNGEALWDKRKGKWIGQDIFEMSAVGPLLYSDVDYEVSVPCSWGTVKVKASDIAQELTSEMAFRHKYTAAEIKRMWPLLSDAQKKEITDVTGALNERSI